MGAHFGVDPVAGETAMQAVSGRDSKGDGKFRPDSDEKRAAADDRIRNLAARWLEQPYQSLEQLRTRQVEG